MKKWTLKDLESKGIKHNLDASAYKQKLKVKPIPKQSKEKNEINLLLWALHRDGTIPSYLEEHTFSNKRKFRFDWAIPELKIAIEYEGVFSGKSRHTTISGYTNDCEKYNLAQIEGWKVLRYTAKNYKKLALDIEKFFEK